MRDDKIQNKISRLALPFYSTGNIPEVTKTSQDSYAYAHQNNMFSPTEWEHTSKFTEHTPRKIHNHFTIP